MSPSGKEAHGQLPTTIDPIQLAERGVHLAGTLPLSAMPRLSQGCLDGSGDVSVDLSFERPESEKLCLMRGVLRAPLRLTCQRCLEPMQLVLEAKPWLILHRSAQGGERPEDDAEFLVADKPLSLSALVEDELLLAMPMVPLHEPRCPTAVGGLTEPGAAKSVKKPKDNPFAILGRWKKLKL